MQRFVLLTAGLLMLAACSGTRAPLPQDVEPIGDFRLGYNIVVANDVQKAPGSRDATEEELVTAVRAATEERLGRYDGEGLYHIGARIEAYSLGKPGIPIVYSPRSVLLIALNVWDDATQEKLTKDAVRITAFEGNAGPLVGSGLVRGKEEQLEALAFDAAKEIEEFLMENPDWFAPKDGREKVPFLRDPLTGRAMAEPGEVGDGAVAVAPLEPPVN